MGAVVLELLTLGVVGAPLWPALLWVARALVWQRRGPWPLTLWRPKTAAP